MSRAANERPSRPLSAYNYFFRQERQRLLKDGGAMVKALGFKGFAKYIGQEWKKIGPQERAQYKDMAARDKARYAREMMVWQNEQAEFLDRFQEAEAEAEAYPKDEEDTRDHAPQDVQTHEAPQEQVHLIPNIRHLQNPHHTQSLSGSTSSQISNLGGFQGDALPVQTLDHRLGLPFYQESRQSSVFFCFDQKTSFANMAQDFGNDGIDYLLHVLDTH